MRVWDMSLLQDNPSTTRAPRESIHAYVYSEANRQQMGQRFRRLQRKLTIGLIIGFLLPNALLAAYFHHQLTHSLKNSAILKLATLADNQKNALDLYLQARVSDLSTLLPDPSLSQAPSQDGLAAGLKRLNALHEDFTGLGLLDAGGTVRAYAGPVPEQGKTLGLAPWLGALFDGSRSYCIGDIHTEEGEVQQGIVAVRRTLDGRNDILFASLNPDRLAEVLANLAPDDTVRRSLLHDQSASGSSKEAEVRERMTDDEPVLSARIRLAEAPWLLELSQPLPVAMAEMYHARRVLLWSLIAITLLFSLLITFTISKLMQDARRMADRGSRLQEMLVHASKLASIGELAAGVAHEINNPLAIIMAESGVIRDMFTPEFELDHSREALEKELAVIDKAATRAKGITRRLQEMAKARVPQSEPCDLNAQVSNTLARLRKVELKAKRNLDIQLDLDPDLPAVLAEAEPIRQVIGNLLLNAADAIGEERGVITISTGMEDRMLAIHIADTGRGIPPENLERIFHPFFTTKGGAYGTGLGLSIAASIVKYLGGVIKVSSIVGKGSTFTVLLPNNFTCPINPQEAA